MSVGFTCPVVRVLLEENTPDTIAIAKGMLASGTSCGRHAHPCRMQGDPRPPVRNTAAPLRVGSRAHKKHLLDLLKNK